jgi:hypothetical protein
MGNGRDPVEPGDEGGRSRDRAGLLYCATVSLVDPEPVKSRRIRRRAAWFRANGAMDEE